jgi:type II secretory pathway predicted ATPase ExeA
MNESVRRLQTFLLANCDRGRHAVLVIDEAHLLLDSDALETVRLLLNFEHAGKPALTLLLGTEGETQMRGYLGIYDDRAAKATRETLIEIAHKCGAGIQPPRK